MSKQRSLRIFGQFCPTIVELRLRNKDVFDTTKVAYGAAKDVPHSIDTGTARPVCQPPHRVSPKERQLIKEMTDEMLKNDVTKTSISPWASPIELVKKKDGKQR